MSPEEAKANNRAERLRFGIRLLMIGVFFGIFAGYHLYLRWRISNHFKELRTAGFHTSITSAAAEYEALKRTSNAASAYLEIFKHLTTFSNENIYAALSKTNGLGLPKFSETQRSKWEKVLVDNEVAYSLIPHATNNFYAAYDYDWTQGPEMLIKELGQLNVLCRLIQIDCASGFASSNRTTVLRDIEYTFLVADSLSLEPIFSSVQVRTRSRYWGYRFVELALNNFELTEEELIRLKCMLDRPSTRPQFQKSLAFERAGVSGLFEHPLAKANPLYGGSRLNRAGEELFAGGLWLVGIWQLDHLNYLRQFHELEVAATETDPFAYARVRGVDAIFDSEKERFSKDLSNHKVGIAMSEARIMSGMYLPGIIRGIRRQIAADADLRIAQTLVAMERYRRKNGRLPAGLNELVPEFFSTVPIDPFTGAALRYKNDGTKVVVYSFGANGRDDGGSEKDGSRPAIG